MAPADTSTTQNQDVSQGIMEIDNAARRLPDHAGKIATNVKDHGIAAFVRDDPELKESGDAIGREMGSGIRRLANVVAQDMVASKKR